MKNEISNYLKENNGIEIKKENLFYFKKIIMNLTWLIIITFLLRYKNSKYKRLVSIIGVSIIIVLISIKPNTYSFNKVFKYELQTNFTKDEIKIFNNCTNSIIEADLRLYPHLLPSGKILYSSEDSDIYNSKDKYLVYSINDSISRQKIDTKITYTYDENFLLKINLINKKYLTILKNSELKGIYNFPITHFDTESLLNISIKEEFKGRENSEIKARCQTQFSNNTDIFKLGIITLIILNLVTNFERKQKYE